jgi:hypothetical protein
MYRVLPRLGGNVDRGIYSTANKLEKRLREECERRMCSEEEIVIEALSKMLDEALDPNDMAELHLGLSEKYLDEAEEFLRKGDYVQASEKAWAQHPSLSGP